MYRCLTIRCNCHGYSTFIGKPKRVIRVIRQMQCNDTTQMRILIPVPISALTFTKQYQNTLREVLKERIKGTIDGLPKEYRVELLHELSNEILDEDSLNND